MTDTGDSAVPPTRAVSTPPAGPAASGLPVTSTPTPERPVILAVDDDPAVLAAVRADLRGRYGRHHRIVTAAGGPEAITVLDQLMLRAQPVAVVVSDQRMPDIEGTAVLAAARRLFPGVRTVLLTAYADTDVAIAAINDVHVDYYVLKPWDPPEQRLFPILDELLEDWHAHHAPAQPGLRVVGSRWSARTHDIRDWLQRNQIPVRWLDVDAGDEGRMLYESAAGATLPLVVTADGRTLSSPDVATLAAALGHKTHADAEAVDLAIIGAGPAGLAAAVYGASEGLRTVCVEQLVPGGQAGQSSRIENYLGFPSGIAGDDLARRAVTQAKRFHVDLLAPSAAVDLDVSGPYPRLRLTDGSTISCGSVILACGVSYRNLDVPGSAALEGRGVFYGAAVSEQDAVAGEDVLVVGGANSAGQAAVFFSAHARSVTILCRADELGAKMSAYLVDQIAARDNILVRCGMSVRAVHGEDRLSGVTVEDASGTSSELAASALFVFIGASPHTAWLPPQIARDQHGFILTGPALGDRRHPGPVGERDPFLYETSAPRVFAVGDVRAGSVKRVASAVGEGSVAVQFVHQVLHA